MLSAKQDGEGLLKDEIVRLTGETQQLQDELLQHKAHGMALQDQLMDLQGTQGGDVGEEVMMLRTRVQVLQLEKEDAVQALQAAQQSSAEREREGEQLQMSLAALSQVVVGE